MIFTVTAGLVVTQSPAAAHGVTMIPGSRTFLCWQDGLRENGQIIPFNPACAAAVNQSGPTPLYNWFAVLRSDAGGRTTGYIPDGELCSGGTGGPYDFSAYNAVRNDWPLTHLTAGRTIQFRHSNWARHPGTFFVHITRNGWNPNAPLRWADLEQVGSVTDPPESGGAGGMNYYFWQGTLPANKTGRHIIYIRWVRSDSMENFFSCSDVMFDGGNGEVTGVGPNGSQPGPTGSNSGGPTASQSNSSGPGTPTGSQSQGNGACSATWTNNPTGWPGHFQATVTVRNSSSSAINGWTVRWNFPGGQNFEGAPWNGRVTSPAPNAAVSNVDWNRSLAPNATTSFGFNGVGTAPSPAPTLSCSSP